MDIFMLQQNDRYKYLVAVDGDVYVYIYGKYKFDKPFVSFKPKHIFVGKSKICDMTEFSGAANNDSDFERITFLLVFSLEYFFTSIFLR